jgi:AcrR family transcriptional regulator
VSIDAGGRSKPQVRAMVLRAALDAIEELGPDRVRVQDIADRAGMSSGHVMYYFGDRDRILVGTLLLSEQNLAERRTRALAKEVDPWRSVERLTRLYLPASSRDVRWTLWAQTIARPPTDRATQEQLRACVDSWSEALAGVITSGRAAGVFRTSDPDATAYRFCRLMDGLAMELLLGAPGHSRAWAVQQANDAFTSWVEQ